MIVPTRNAATTLEACLESIRAQRDCRIELIVVDNYSSDDTCLIAERFANRLESLGPERSAQRNRGAELSIGSYLLFIDADMRLEPTVVSDCMDTLSRSRAPAVIIPEDSVGVGYWANCRALERSCYHDDDTVEAARFFLRAGFWAVGGYDSQLIAGEDWDLSDRIARGRSLPRIKAHISHDEGHLRLWPHLAKKHYYGRGLPMYWRKPIVRSSNSLIRSAYLRHWRTLLRRPILTSGMVFLKAAEAAAIASGVLAGRRDRISCRRG